MRVSRRLVARLVLSLGCRDLTGIAEVADIEGVLAYGASRDEVIAQAQALARRTPWES